MTIIQTPFVFGHPRSGTSLLTAILDRHSRIAMLPETHLLHALRDTTTPLGHERLLVLAWDRLRTRMGDLHFTPAEILRQFRDHASTPEGLVQALLELWAQRAGKSIAGEKTPSHLAYADRILSAIPGARAILLIRDGRAVVEAMRRTPAHDATPLEALVDGWIRAAELTDEWLERFPDRAHLIRFEDLVARPEESLTPLLAWLGVEFEPAILQAQPTATFRRWEDYVKRDVVKPIMAEKAEAWRTGGTPLPPALTRRMGGWLSRFGYECPEPCHRPQRKPRSPPALREPLPTDKPPIILIGAHRAGTASLNAWLGLHPDVAVGPGRSRPLLALDWPLSRAQLLQRLASEMETTPRDGQAWSHAASYYLAHPDLPRRLRQLLPDARVIVVLRDPVARAFSHWLHAWRMGVEPLGFDSAVTAERSRIGDSAHTLAADERAVSFNHVHFSYELQGHYATHLDRWLRVFPREQILVLTLESLAGDPQEGWRRICAHAALSHCSTPGLPMTESLPWPLSPEAVRSSAGARHIHAATFGEHSRLAELLQHDVPWAADGSG